MVAMLIIGCRTATMSDRMAIYDLEQKQSLTGAQAVKRMQNVRIVLVGEHHNNADHHLAQLQIIQALHNAGRKVAIGMEMFRQESQQALNQWTAGQLEEDQFIKIFNDNWTFGWKLYRPILTYARDNQLPVVGLNVSRKITAQVAYYGFESLNSEQKGALEGITCNVTPEYRDFIQKAYGAHEHGRMNLDRFCEAQLVWDSIMALNAIAYLNQHNETMLVIVAGSGHARKLGIPTQLAKRTAMPYVVILPETEGVFDRDTLSALDADFLLLNQ
jgi:uncharacterized iron-regulated protein